MAQSSKVSCTEAAIQPDTAGSASLLPFRGLFCRASRRSVAAGLAGWLPIALVALALSACASTPAGPSVQAGEAPLDFGPGWDPDVRDKLMALIAGAGRGTPGFNPAKPPLVVLDFDNTCIRGDLGRAFYDWMVRTGRLKITSEIYEVLPADKRDAARASYEALTGVPAEARAGSPALQAYRKIMHQVYWNLCHKSEAGTCYPWQVRFYAGYTPDELRTWGSEVMAAELNRPIETEQLRATADDPEPAVTSNGIRVHREIKQLVALLAEQGIQVWIVTAGPQWVVEAAAGAIGLPQDRVLGMRAVLRDGRLTTQMDGPPTFREGKAQVIEQVLGQRPILSIGDSWADAAMLAMSEHAVLIDRGYADLKKHAAEAGWWIQPAFTAD